jgi:hypothetical protein
VYNAVSMLYAMTKIPACREFLAAADKGMNADVHLMRLSQLDNPRLKSNCARTLKNLASDASEAIEEGAVAALIAMSLEVRCFLAESYFLRGNNSIS